MRMRQLWMANEIKKKEHPSFWSALDSFPQKKKRGPATRVQHSHRSTEPRNVMSNDTQFIAIGAAHIRDGKENVFTLCISIATYDELRSACEHKLFESGIIPIC